MIRIIVDKLGSGHYDIFLKIDNLPTYTKTGDSYYLLDFLEISNEELKKNNVKDEQVLNYSTTKLIDYWNSRIGTEEKGKEQIKIANFLSAIDDKINHTVNQIQQTQ